MYIHTLIHLCMHVCTYGPRVYVVGYIRENVHTFIFTRIRVNTYMSALWVWRCHSTLFKSGKKQEKPTNPNANHVKETQVKPTRIKCRCGV